MRRIHRYSVPIYNKTTEHSFLGKIVYVGCTTEDIVEFWAEVYDSDLYRQVKKFEVYPTGESIPDDAQYIGTAISPSRKFVWHLYERFI